MSRPIRESIKRLRGWVMGSESRMKKIVRGEGAPGTRAAPTQSGNNDKKIGLRLDHGDIVVKDGKKFRRYKLQINKGAENPTLKALADKDSHRVWSHADIPIDDTDKTEPGKLLETFFEDLETNIES